MEMNLRNPACFSIAALLMLTLVACNQDQATPQGTTANSPHFTVTLSGEHVDGELVINLPAAQITGIAYDTGFRALYVRGAEDDAKVLTMTLSVDGPAVSTGTYLFTDRKAQMTLGAVAFEQGTSMEGESGAITLTTYDEAARKAAGTVDGQFRSTNYKDKVYTVKGSFLLHL